MQLRDVMFGRMHEKRGNLCGVIAHFFCCDSKSMIPFKLGSPDPQSRRQDIEQLGLTGKIFRNKKLAGQGTRRAVEDCWPQRS